MEAVNVVGSAQNQITLHTTDGCKMDVKRKETGTVLKTNCLNSTDDNAGCGIDAGTETFGEGYNNNGGGVMALELRTAGIRAWQFGRASIPSDITAGSPDPSSWGTATADFPSTSCDIDTHFRNQSIVANIDLCGSWAGTQSVYSQTCEFSPPHFPPIFSPISASFANANSRLWYLPRSSRKQQHRFHECILGIRRFLCLLECIVLDQQLHARVHFRPISTFRLCCRFFTCTY